MAYFPMRQTITINRGSGTLDEWGKEVPGATLTVKCRVNEGSFTTTTAAAHQTGKEVVADLKVLIDKLADIRYDDVIRYVNELGNTYERTPKKITVLRDIGGKPVMTEVLL